MFLEELFAPSVDSSYHTFYRRLPDGNTTESNWNYNCVPESPGKSSRLALRLLPAVVPRSKEYLNCTVLCNQWGHY